MGLSNTDGTVLVYRNSKTRIRNSGNGIHGQIGHGHLSYEQVEIPKIFLLGRVNFLSFLAYDFAKMSHTCM